MLSFFVVAAIVVLYCIMMGVTYAFAQIRFPPPHDNDKSRDVWFIAALLWPVGAPFMLGILAFRSLVSVQRPGDEEGDAPTIGLPSARIERMRREKLEWTERR
jgi:hypothetical protein